MIICPDSQPWPITGEPFHGIAHREVQVPSDPVCYFDYLDLVDIDLFLKSFSDREALNLHAEVKALQARLGLSYKDAAHRLYFGEVERLKAEKQADAAMTGIHNRIDKTICNEIYPVISSLDKGEVNMDKKKDY